MTTLKRYIISYFINGQAETLVLDEFATPSLDQARLQILLKHVSEPRATEDAPWENPREPSVESRIGELGVSDIRVELLA